MIEKLLLENEGKTLEFKERIQGALNFVKTVVAFANTAGGTVVIGVSDKVKEICGVENVLAEVERIANIIFDSIAPAIMPEIEIVTYRNRELVLVKVPHVIGPYYVKSLGQDKGTYVRFGSTNRLADSEMQEALKRLSRNISFDELPCIGASIDDLDQSLIVNSFDKHQQKVDHKNYQGFGITVNHFNKPYPTNAAMLLFSKDRLQWFPDALIRCIRFKDTDKYQILDQKEITGSLLDAVEEIISFIERHTNTSAHIGRIQRTDVPEYSYVMLREAVINAILHADYALKGAAIQIEIFSDRVEITNPGSLPFGQTIESALAGVSRLRNRVIGRLFRRLKLVEQLGSGLQRIIRICRESDTKLPLFEEFNNHFRVTLFPTNSEMVSLEQWQEQLLINLAQGGSLQTKEIAALWQITPRTARARLQKMQAMGFIKRIATSQKDPNAAYIIRGIRVGLSDITDNIMAYPNVAQAVVCAEKQRQQTQLTVYFMRANKKEPLSIVALKRYLQQTLPSYMLPANFYEVEAFPLDADGEINKQLLLEQSKHIHKQE